MNVEDKMISRDEYLKKIVPQLKMQSIADDLVDFTGLNLEQIREKKDSAYGIIEAEWMSSKPENNSESVKNIYRQTKGGYLFSWAFSDRSRYSKYQCVQPFLKGKTLLDYGTATGDMALFAAILDGFKCTAADLNTPYFEFAQYRFNKYQHCEALNLDEQHLPGKQFDTILLLDVLEHVVDWKELLEGLVKSMNKSGRLIIIVDYYVNPDGSLHISDKTGLTEITFMHHMKSLGLVKTEQTGDIEVFEWLEA